MIYKRECGKAGFKALRTFAHLKTMLMCCCNPSTWEAKIGGQEVKANLSQNKTRPSVLLNDQAYCRVGKDLVNQCSVNGQCRWALCL